VEGDSTRAPAARPRHRRPTRPTARGCEGRWRGQPAVCPCGGRVTHRRRRGASHPPRRRVWVAAARPPVPWRALVDDDGVAGGSHHCVVSPRGRTRCGPTRPDRPTGRRQRRRAVDGPRDPGRVGLAAATAAVAHGGAPGATPPGRNIRGRGAAATAKTATLTPPPVPLAHAVAASASRSMSLRESRSSKRTRTVCLIGGGGRQLGRAVHGVAISGGIAVGVRLGYGALRVDLCMLRAVH